MTQALRIGHGYDVHAFTEGDHIILGGVTIPFEKGIAAHSDGDVVLHALSDAMLGSLALSDIGHHFPDTDAAYKNADSRVMFRSVNNLINDRGYQLVNADITIQAQAPKMASHIEMMRENISADLGISISQISVKATTTEKLGFVGQQLGIAVDAVVLLEKI